MFKPKYPELMERVGGDLRKYHDCVKKLSDDLAGKDEERSFDALVEAGRCLIRLEINPAMYVCRTCHYGCVYIDPTAKGCIPDHCPLDGGVCEWKVEDPGDVDVPINCGGSDVGI